MKRTPSIHGADKVLRRVFAQTELTCCVHRRAYCRARLGAILALAELVGFIDEEYATFRQIELRFDLRPVEIKRIQAIKQ